MIFHRTKFYHQYAALSWFVKWPSEVSRGWNVWNWIVSVTVCVKARCHRPSCAVSDLCRDSSIQLEKGLLLGIEGNGNNMTFIALQQNGNEHCMPEVWEWTVVRRCCQFLIRIQAFLKLNHNCLPDWEQEERSLLPFSNLSLFTLSVCPLGAVVRFWLQLSSEGGECNCSSRGRGHRGLPSKQSG